MRRLRLAGVGAAMVLFALSPVIMKAAASVLTGNAERLTPAWVLDSRVRSQYGDADAANELARRMAARTISESRVRSLVEHGLEWQREASMGGTHLFPSRPSGVYWPSQGEELLWSGMHWPEVLEGALLAGYMSPEQVERFLAQGLLVEVYGMDERTVDVQVMSLLGPRLSAMLDIDVRERSFELSNRRFSAMGSGGAVPTWWWQFAVAQRIERVQVMWRIDARRVLEAVGRGGEELGGEFEAELPLNVDTPRVLRKWRPLAR